ncbi:Aspartyl/glutamyl-tRNA(Asn/Gln) amidotransferase subunit C [uncultured archaeon]|nr:Aspartyl/glutamyl-tRNA(Asn/Gln) amidotransferase subunit C [uncultured archaeon]
MQKTKITKELLLKVSANSRLSLTETEVKKFLPQLEAVLESFSKLDEADIKGTEPSFQPIPLKNVFREDLAIAGNCIPNETALANTAHKKDGYFKGPKVV